MQSGAKVLAMEPLRFRPLSVILGLGGLVASAGKFLSTEKSHELHELQRYS